MEFNPIPEVIAKYKIQNCAPLLLFIQIFDEN